MFYLDQKLYLANMTVIKEPGLGFEDREERRLHPSCASLLST